LNSSCSLAVRKWLIQSGISFFRAFSLVGFLVVRLNGCTTSTVVWQVRIQAACISARQAWHALARTGLKKYFFYRPIALSHIVSHNRKTELSLSTKSRHMGKILRDKKKIGPIVLSHIVSWGVSAALLIVIRIYISHPAITPPCNAMTRYGNLSSMHGGSWRHT
jgi:hypothetical protein